MKFYILFNEFCFRISWNLLFYKISFPKNFECYTWVIFVVVFNLLIKLTRHCWLNLSKPLWNIIQESVCPFWFNKLTIKYLLELIAEQFKVSFLIIECFDCMFRLLKRATHLNTYIYFHWLERRNTFHINYWIDRIYKVQFAWKNQP